MNNIDAILENLPLLGLFFQKTYAFWRTHTGIANITHVVFGIGLGLVFVYPRKKVGVLLIVMAVGIHIVAFIVGS